ncbi:MAG: hypothetical protein IE927_01855 [Rhodobacterales bacterium]|nr:hypothetical protein [Rhodobacterales bacterium]
MRGAIMWRCCPFATGGAELMLPPTRSLARTRTRLCGLPGGGGTPLAAGLRLALDTATRPQPQLAALAAAMGARYLALPRAGSAGMAATLGAALEA